MRNWWRLAVCTPSRGLMHSRTAEAVIDNIAQFHPFEWRWFFSHDKPIPDCFNDVVGRAYDWDADVFWIVEDDVQPPSSALSKMWNALHDNTDVAVSDYLMEDLLHDNDFSWGVCYDGSGRVTWCRTGCILFKRKCLDALPKPWFTLRNRLVKPGVVTWDEGQDRGYGADIPFAFSLYQLGFRFHVIDETCEHLRVVEWGNERGDNCGYHRIEPLGGYEWQESMGPMRPSRLALPQMPR